MYASRSSGIHAVDVQQARKPDALTAIRGEGALRWLRQLRRRLRESLEGHDEDIGGNVVRIRLAPTFW